LQGVAFTKRHSLAYLGAIHAQGNALTHARLLHRDAFRRALLADTGAIQTIAYAVLQDLHHLWVVLCGAGQQSISVHT
jgi:hypothetical protein